MNPSSRSHLTDPVAAVTIVVAGLVALVIAWWLPWWAMHAQAPQYGKQTLIVQISPTGATGDVKEIDTLGHYVGMAPIADYAPIERKIAPFGFLAAAIGFLIAPITRRKWLKGAFILPIVALSLFFLWDLRYWTFKSVTDRDPHAALSNTVKEIHPRLEGEYSVGQFVVHAKVEGGLCAAALAGILALGLLFMEPAPVPEWTHRITRRLRPRAPVAAALAAGVLLARASPAQAAEIAVEPGGSVAAALARATDGDTVRVPSGVFRERVVIDRRVALVGVPGAVLDGGGEGTVVTIGAAGASLRGIGIRRSGSNYLREDSGIRIDHAADVRIEDVALDEVLFGVFVVQGDRCAISGSSIRGKDVPVTDRGDAIRLWYSSGCAIRDNRIDRSRDLVIWYSKGTEVTGNVIAHGRYGLHYMFSDSNVFRGNRFEWNQVGAAIMNSRGITLDGNTFSWSRGPSALGLLLKDCDDVAIERNRFESNATAIFIDNAPQSRGAFLRFDSNLVAANDVGIALQPLAREADIRGNAFVDNAVQVQVLGNGTASGERWEGNYWSDATVYDRDGDGVSELPYRLENGFESLAANHPALEFFRGTPGADAVDRAGRLFPIFAPRATLEDARPLAAPPALGVPPAVAAGKGGADLAASSSLLALGAAFVLHVARRAVS